MCDRIWERPLIEKIYEVWHWPENQRKTGLCRPYVNKWLKDNHCEPCDRILKGGEKPRVYEDVFEKTECTRMIELRNAHMTTEYYV